MAVSAVTAQQLQNSGASDIRQLNQLSPTLYVSSTSSEAGAGVARIRGIGTVGDNPGLESSVGLFIDGVYRSRTGVGLSELGPLDRIEVLRGPQGTLFGRNTSAGLISIITAKPQFETSVYGQLDVGNYDFRKLQLGVTGPAFRNRRGAPRRRHRQARRLHQEFDHRRPRQRPRPLDAARPGAVPAEQRPQLPPDRRLYQARRNLLRRALSRRPAISSPASAARRRRPSR